MSETKETVFDIPKFTLYGICAHRALFFLFKSLGENMGEELEACLQTETPCTSCIMNGKNYDNRKP